MHKYTKPTEFGYWAIDRHKETNHYYATNLPYSYHLELTVKTGYRFQHLVEDIDFYWIENVLWGHDTMEDARVTYNDIINELKKQPWYNEVKAKKIAEAIRAVTNYGRGRDRNERMPDYIYKEIRNTEGATFVKLCDRIANCKHGLISGSSMLKKYKKENEHFKEMLYTEEYKEMWDYLDKILNMEL